MAKPTFYLQVDFEGEETTSTGEFREGYGRRSVVVEVRSGAYENPGDNRIPDEVAEDIARNTANELVKQELVELADNEGALTRLEELPPVLQDVEPDVIDSDVRAWLLKESQ
jgi:hypothetical protein